MPLIRRIAVRTVLVAALVSLAAPGSALAQPAAPDVLAVPGPVAVSLDPGTTAFPAIDLLQSNCAPVPACVATLPAIASGMASARAAGATVIHSVHPGDDNKILPPAVQPGEPVFVAVPGDKFFNSDLDSILQRAGVTTLVLTGTSSNSGVLYTSAAAIQRGYTVVVAGDAISAGSDLATSVATWQMLNGPGANAQNAPLRPRAVTFSRTDQITYQ